MIFLTVFDTSFRICVCNFSVRPNEKPTLGLARVGSRAALNFSFAYLRRAWRSGEDVEFCSELLSESLEALQSLPEATLFDETNVSQVWLEVVERSAKFLRQVVTGYLSLHFVTTLSLFNLVSVTFFSVLDVTYNFINFQGYSEWKIMVSHPNIRSTHGSLFAIGTGDTESYTV